MAPEPNGVASRLARVTPGCGHADSYPYSLLVVDFEEQVRDALATLPRELHESMSNVEIVIDEEPPAGMPLLGLYQGVPLTQRGAFYAGALPDKIEIYRGPLERLYGANDERLREEIRRVVLHEVAHHFGISDERLIEMDRY